MPCSPDMKAGRPAGRPVPGFSCLVPDDVINIAAHRISTLVIEDVVNSHSDVIEAAVVGVPHDTKGTVPAAFIVLREGAPSDPSLQEMSNIAPVGSSDPVRIEIPSIAVDSALIGLGLQSDGSREVSPGGFSGGWYAGSPTPGELGSSTVAGHVDWAGDPGIFFRLDELTEGDSISIDRQDGSTATFTVTVVEQ